MQQFKQEQISRIYPFAKKDKIELFLPYLNEYMDLYEINTPYRQAAFLAQIGHESGQFFYTEEIASGKAYEGRIDLGNTSKGDGTRFKGRGLIQITGRSNYSQISEALGIDFLAYPELLKKPVYAVQSACWWWHNRKLNTLADSPSETNFKKITHIINGGYNGYIDRYKMWERAKQILLNG